MSLDYEIASEIAFQAWMRGEDMDQAYIDELDRQTYSYFTPETDPYLDTYR